MAKINYLSGYALTSKLQTLVHDAFDSRYALANTTLHETYVAELDARFYGDDRLNQIAGSDREPKGLFSCESNAVPFHICRVAAFLHVTAERVKAGSLALQQDMDKEEFVKKLQALSDDFLENVYTAAGEKIGVDDPKKFAIAALITLKYAQPDSALATAVSTLEAQHDQFINAGNDMNAWIRDSKAAKDAAQLFDSPRPPRKFLQAPVVLEALSKVEDALTHPKKPIIDRDAAVALVGQFANAFKAQVLEDIAKSLPKEMNDIKDKLNDPSIVTDHARLSEVSDALLQKNDHRLQDAIKVLSVLGNSRSR